VHTERFISTYIWSIGDKGVPGRLLDRASIRPIPVTSPTLTPNLLSDAQNNNALACSRTRPTVHEQLGSMRRSAMTRCGRQTPPARRPVPPLRPHSGRRTPARLRKHTFTRRTKGNACALQANRQPTFYGGWSRGSQRRLQPNRGRRGSRPPPLLGGGVPDLCQPEIAETWEWAPERVPRPPAEPRTRRSTTTTDSHSVLLLLRMLHLTQTRQFDGRYKAASRTEPPDRRLARPVMYAKLRLHGRQIHAHGGSEKRVGNQAAPLLD